jgi:hypothetical protein
MTVTPEEWPIITWSTKQCNVNELEKALNDYSEQGYEIFQIFQKNVAPTASYYVIIARKVNDVNYHEAYKMYVDMCIGFNVPFKSYGEYLDEMMKKP